MGESGAKLEQLGSKGVLLVVGETGDEKWSTDAVGAARQYPGCAGQDQVVPGRGAPVVRECRRTHVLIDRRRCLGEAWDADDERRELAGVPDETGFATKPQLAA